MDTCPRALEWFMWIDVHRQRHTFWRYRWKIDTFFKFCIKVAMGLPTIFVFSQRIINFLQFDSTDRYLLFLYFYYRDHLKQLIKSLGTACTSCSNNDYCSPVLCSESEAKNPFLLFSRLLRLAREGLGCMHILCSRAYSGATYMSTCFC